MSKAVTLAILLVFSSVAPAQSPSATQGANRASGSNQVSYQQLSAEQKEVWSREQDYFRYLNARNLDGFMSLWHDGFIGWPDYSDHPVRKPEIRASVEGEFRGSQTATPPLPAPELEAVETFGNVAITHYFWPGSDGSSQLRTRATHTWRKGPTGWVIIGGMACDVEVKSSRTESNPVDASGQQASVLQYGAGASDDVVAEGAALDRRLTDIYLHRDWPALAAIVAPDYDGTGEGFEWDFAALQREFPKIQLSELHVERQHGKRLAPDLILVNDNLTMRETYGNQNISGRYCPLSTCALPRLSLAQDGSGKSFVHAICGPYLQRCGNKL